MKEEFLHFIWKHKLFGLNTLCTIDNEPIEIINPGIHNTDAGPDFFNAKIKIGDTLWAGNVEIHVKSSDWVNHNHHKDKSYSNIILHAVYQHDAKHQTTSSYEPPILLIPISAKLEEAYQSINSKKTKLYCYGKIKEITDIEISNYLEYILIERLEEKYTQALTILENSNTSWNTLFYYLLLKSFGGYTNNAAFELIAPRIQHQIIARHSDNLFQLEALLFGISGFLSTPALDSYHSELSTEFEFLKEKYDLKPIEPHIWKFLRLRPSNFPTIRIAQLAALIHKTGGMFLKMAQTTKNNNIFALLDIQMSPYWKTHYQFGKSFKDNWETSLGNQTKNLIVCNVIIPFLFTFYKQTNDTMEIDKLLNWMLHLPPEKNSIITMWHENGINSTNMAHSQALYHLTSRYCTPRRCLHCRIGQKVLARTSNEE